MIKISHQNPDKTSAFSRGTIAIEIPEKQVLVDMFTNNLSNLYLRASASYVHKKDQYNKKIGTQRALCYLENEDPRFCQLIKIEPRNDCWIFHFKTVVPDTRPNTSFNMDIEFGVSMSKLSETTRLQYAYFKE